MIEVKHAKIWYLICRGTLPGVLRADLSDIADKLIVEYVFVINPSEEHEKINGKYAAEGHLNITKDYSVHGVLSFKFVADRILLVHDMAKKFCIYVKDV